MSTSQHPLYCFCFMWFSFYHDFLFVFVWNFSFLYLVFITNFVFVFIIFGSSCFPLISYDFVASTLLLCCVCFVLVFHFMPPLFFFSFYCWITTYNLNTEFVCLFLSILYSYAAPLLLYGKKKQNKLFTTFSSSIVLIVSLSSLSFFSFSFF